MKHEREALNEALHDWIEATTGLQAFPWFAPGAGETFPFVIYFPLSGGRDRSMRKPIAELTYAIKVISDDMAEALQYAGAIADGMDDIETKGGLTAAGWHVINSRRGLAIDLCEQVDNSQIYHEGDQYTFEMEVVDG